MGVWGRSLGCGLSGRWRRLDGFLGRQMVWAMVNRQRESRLAFAVDVKVLVKDGVVSMVQWKAVALDLLYYSIGLSVDLSRFWCLKHLLGVLEVMRFGSWHELYQCTYAMDTRDPSLEFEYTSLIPKALLNRGV